MHAEHQTEGELLAELRQLHGSERAPAELRERLVERLRRGPEPDPRASRRSGRPWLALAAVALIALAFRTQQRVKHTAPPSFGTVAAEPHDAPRVVRPPTPRPERCPLDEVPREARYEPQHLETFDAPTAASNLELSTFAMPIPGCAPVIRRYLTYLPRSVPVPDSLAVPRSAPVLIVLHESGDSAEGVRALQAHRTFETLADREGLIVVYANAGPGAKTGRFPNSGGWQTDPGANRALDDEAYLAAVIEQLQKRGAIAGGNAVFLVGYGGGGALALEAAANHPDRYVGVAALVPTRPNRARPEEHLQRSRLSRMLFIVPASDHPDDYWPGKPLDVAVLEEWAVAIGLPRFSVAQRQEAQRLGHILEEPGAPELAGLPRGSSHFDFGPPVSGAPHLRVLVVPHGSDLDVGPNGTAAPVDVAAQVWSLLEDTVH